MDNLTSIKLIPDPKISTVIQNAMESKTYSSVQEYYGKVLTKSKDLKTGACTAGGKPHQLIREALKLVPDEIIEKFYGCGNPIPLGIEGLDVHDLGSGSGRDCYVASALVGSNGSVTG